MPVRVQTIADLLEQEEWETCAKLAAAALAEGEQTVDKAFLSYAICRSMSQQNRYTEALDLGQRGLYLAETIGDYDLLGRILIEVAWCQQRTPGMERQAVGTYRRYFSEFERYGEAARRYYLPAMFNLGASLRAAGDHEEALRQFMDGYAAAKARKEYDIGDILRRNATWQALQMKRVELAAGLIEQGRTYVERNGKDVRVVANHLLNEAQLCLQKDQIHDAAAIAVEVALLAEEIPELIGEAFDILHLVAKQTGEIEGALALAVLAKAQAEQDERFDMLARLRASVRVMSIQFPEAAERFIGALTRQNA